MRHLCLFTFHLLFVVSISISQKPTIQTPDVASINRFLDVPVDKSTGVPNVNIPLYNISVNGFSLPISLSYHAGGIRVEEEASSVGLGWALNAGGVISRTVKHKPDELGGYYTNSGTPQPQQQMVQVPYRPCDACAVEPGTVYNIVDGAYDTEPDLFYFSVNGLSGKFVFDKARKARLIPEQDLKIEADQFLTEFTLTNSDGTQYIFSTSAKEVTSSTDLLGNSSGKITSAWRLVQIITAKKNNIYFDYVAVGTSFQKVQPHEAFISRDLLCPQSIQPYSYSHLEGKLVHAIRFKNGRIDFQYKSSYREDYVTNSLGINLMRALESIKITNTDANTVIKKYKLNTSYFTSTGQEPEEYLKKRLRLDEILECDSLGNNCLPPYKFSYNKHNTTYNNFLPSRISRGQDHWGYYNGADYNSSLYTGLNCSSNANREPNLEYKGAFILDEIQFPTGGVKSFFFESTPTGASSGSNGIIPTMGGLRIREIIDNPGNNLQTITKLYTYSNSITVGGDPVYIQAIETSSVFGLVADPWMYNICNQYFYQGFTPNYYYVFQSPVNYSGEITSNHVIHGLVTERISGQGSIETEFDISHVSDEIDLYEAQTYPFVVTMPLLLTGKQIREAYKDETGNALKEIFYEYGSTRTQVISFPDAFKVYKPFCKQEIRHYELYTGFASLDRRREFVYQNAGQTPLLTEVTYEYGGLPTPPANRLHHFVTKETTTSSDGSSVIKRFKYPLDYKAEIGVFGSSDVWDNASKGIQEAIKQNQISAPVEQIITRQKSGVESIIRGNLISFISRTNSLNKMLVSVDKMLTLNIAVPIPFQSSFFSTITKNGNTYQFGRNTNYFIEAEFLKYDDVDNPLEMKGKDGVRESYVWGYNTLYPIAKVINAEANEIYHSSFEASGTWGNGPEWQHGASSLTAFDNSRSRSGRLSGKIEKLTAGEKVVHADQWLSISNSTPKEYKYSGWVYSNGPTVDIYLFMKTATETFYYTNVDYVHTNVTNQWVYVEKTFSVPANITKLNIRVDNNGGGTVWFDDIRLHPQGALMTTYTYDPLIGMTSQTDLNLRSTYFDYDNFGRLYLVRDHDKNILKKYCYNYQGQQEDCSAACTNITPSWVNVGSPYCEIANGVNTGNQLQNQVDNNPCSNSYNNPRTVSVSNSSACPPPITIYAKLTYENYQSTWYGEYADVIVRFYSDAAGQSPISVSGLQLNYVRTGHDGYNSFAYPYSTPAYGTECVLDYGAELTYYYTQRYQNFFLQSGNYNIIW